MPPPQLKRWSFQAFAAHSVCLFATHLGKTHIWDNVSIYWSNGTEKDKMHRREKSANYVLPHHDCTVAYTSIAAMTIDQFYVSPGVPLHTAFHYHPNVVLIWLKYCWKGRKIASHPPIHPSIHPCVSWYDVIIGWKAVWQWFWRHFKCRGVSWQAIFYVRLLQFRRAA